MQFSVSSWRFFCILKANDFPTGFPALSRERSTRNVRLTNGDTGLLSYFHVHFCVRLQRKQIVNETADLPPRLFNNDVHGRNGVWFGNQQLNGKAEIDEKSALAWGKQT